METPAIVTAASYFDALSQGGGVSALSFGQGDAMGGPLAEFNGPETRQSMNGGGSAFARTGLAVQIGGAWVLVIGILVVSYLMFRRVGA